MVASRQTSLHVSFYPSLIAAEIILIQEDCSWTKCLLCIYMVVPQSNSKERFYNSPATSLFFLSLLYWLYISFIAQKAKYNENLYLRIYNQKKILILR